MEEKLQRLGSIAKDKDGSLVLINEDKEGFRVDEVIAAVWYESDGKTIDEITEKFCGEEKEKFDLIKKDIENIVARLREVKLVK